MVVMETSFMARCSMVELSVKVCVILILFTLQLSNVSSQSFMSEENNLLNLPALRNWDCAEKKRRKRQRCTGPYRAVVTNTSSCVVGPPWIHFSIASYTRKEQSLLRGSINATKIIKDVKFRLQMYYLEAKKVKVFDRRNQNCHNTIIEVILNTIHLPFNKQNCNIKPGFYEFNDLNLDKIIHTVVPSLWYGEVQLRLDVDIPGLQIICIDICYSIVKIDNKTR